MKRIASLLLTVALLAIMLSVFAVPASAESQTIPGTDITWELTENDTKLIIDGEGAMPDYADYKDLPWADAVKSITAVEIISGVKSISNYAFYDCINLKSVTIPSGVTSIGIFAFANCTSLESVTIPSGVTSIGIFAFANCTSLKSVTIPSGVMGIGDSMFAGCTNLESVSFPPSITSIGMCVFERCSNLTSVTVKAKTALNWQELFALYSNGAKFTVYIPDGMSNVYKKTVYWSQLISQKKVKEAYVVDDQPGENGTIMLDKDCFPEETYTAANETVTVTVMPAAGYQLKADSLSVVAENGAAIALTQDETDPMKYTFTMPCSNVTVKAEFEEITDESEPTLTATVFSEGNLWIIIAVAVVVIVGIAALVIVKKKKKPVLANGESKDEE